MKRILLATTLLLLAGVGVSALHVKANRAQQQLQFNQHDWQTRTQRLAELEITRTSLTEQVCELKREVRHLEANAPAESPWSALLNPNRLAALTPELRERLLADLGLNWHSSDQWLLVSKTTLAEVRLGALQRNKLTDAACGVLAIRPEERQQLDAAFARVREQYADWVRANIQRAGPSGETLVRYTLPSDATFAESLTNALGSAFVAALGPERACLLDQYSTDWVRGETGFLGAAINSLTVLRRTDAKGKGPLMYKVERGGSFGMSSEGPGLILPVSHFPGEFRTVFPGGWPEVAQREGFELPEGFVNRPPVDTRSRLQSVFPKITPKQ